MHYAKNSLGWSAYLNGMQTDYDEFVRGLQQVGEYLSQQQAEATAYVKIERPRPLVLHVTLGATRWPR